MSSKWEEYKIEEKVLEILETVPQGYEAHHMGRPFLTAYQIAIAFAQRHPDVVDALGHPVGGKGIGVRYSLASYLAQQLSLRINNGLLDVEGGFLSNTHLKKLTFDHYEDKDDVIISSLTETQYPLSMFRLRPS